MKKPRISSLPVGPRPKAGRRCRSKLISVVSCTATTLRPLHAAAVRATWGVSSAVGSIHQTTEDDAPPSRLSVYPPKGSKHQRPAGDNTLQHPFRTLVTPHVPKHGLGPSHRHPPRINRDEGLESRSDLGWNRFV